MNRFSKIKPAPYGRFEREVMTIAGFKAFMSECGLPVSLTEVGIKESDIPAIVEGVKEVSFNADGVLACNPPVSAETLAEILKEAL